MKKKDFLDKMELIDLKYIEESETAARRSKRSAPLIAAVLLLCTLIIAIPLATNKKQPSDAPPAENTETVGAALIQAPETKENDDIPTEPYPYSSEVSFSEIKLPPDDDFTPSESTTQGSATGDIAPFYEEFTADCDFIEGKVVNIYEKHYEYTVISHKFKEGDRAVCNTDSVIYEFEISRVWRGDFNAGETILIEDMQLFCDTQFYMQKGHSYLIPIRNAGERIAILSLNADTAEGETERQTPYTTEYPYHPQIEITLDGYYLFPDEWTTLAEPSEELIKVTDAEFDQGTLWYKDKMVLLDPDTFEIRIKKLLSQ